MFLEKDFIYMYFTNVTELRGQESHRDHSAWHPGGLPGIPEEVPWIPCLIHV